MATFEDRAHAIYAATVQEAAMRLVASSKYLTEFRHAGLLPAFESSVLQLRKALEAIALASIAPNEQAYAAYRQSAEEQRDYTKDYHAKKILRVLSKINPDFYPIALTGPSKMPDGTLFFGRKTAGFLTKARFEAVYDRLGKHLHAHNPWSGGRDVDGLADELPETVEEALGLLELHATFIRTKQFTGAWVMQVARDGSSSRLVSGSTQGEFTARDA